MDDDDAAGLNLIIRKQQQMMCAQTLLKTKTLANLHTISKSAIKLKPKIRIIHIFAPEIIKTDAANFRELVQRLTGKPTEDDSKKRRRVMKRKRRSDEEQQMKESRWIKGDEHEQEQEELWREANSELAEAGGGFLAGFPHQFDQCGGGGSFLQMHEDLNNHFSLLPTTTTMTTRQIQMDVSSSSSSYAPYLA